MSLRQLGLVTIAVFFTVAMSQGNAQDPSNANVSPTTGQGPVCPWTGTCSPPSASDHQTAATKYMGQNDGLADAALLREARQEAGTIQERCLASWDDSFNVHSWDPLNPTHPENKKLRHCI